MNQDLETKITNDDERANDSELQTACIADVMTNIIKIIKNIQTIGYSENNFWTISLTLVRGHTGCIW